MMYKQMKKKIKRVVSIKQVIPDYMEDWTHFYKVVHFSYNKQYY